MRAQSSGTLTTPGAHPTPVSTGATMHYAGLGMLFGASPDTLRNIKDVVVSYGGKKRAFFISGAEQDEGTGAVTLHSARGETILVRRCGDHRLRSSPERPWPAGIHLDRRLEAPLVCTHISCSDMN